MNNEIAYSSFDSSLSMDSSWMVLSSARFVVESLPGVPKFNELPAPRLKVEKNRGKCLLVDVCVKSSNETAGVRSKRVETFDQTALTE